MEQSPEINPYVYGQRLFGKAAENTQWGNDAINSLFNNGENGTFTCQTTTFDPLLTPCKKLLIIQEGLKTRL